MITVIANLKGGTGKSTVNFNLAVWLAIRDREVMLFDLDPQKTLSDVMEVRREEGYTPEVQISDKVTKLKPESLRGFEVLVDVGTSDMKAMNEALRRADRLVIPVPPSQADVWATQRFLRTIKRLREGKDMPGIFGFVNRADTHLFVRETEETAEALKLLPGIQPLKSRLHQRTAFRRSFSEGLSVIEMQPMSKAARELNKLAKELYE